jgi:hypothetical protein
MWQCKWWGGLLRSSLLLMLYTLVSLLEMCSIWWIPVMEIRMWEHFIENKQGGGESWRAWL